MKTAFSRHVFTHNGDPPDFDNKRYCTCGVVETHPRHDVPPVSQDELEAEARLMGEGGEHGR